MQLLFLEYYCNANRNSHVRKYKNYIFRKTQIPATPPHLQLLSSCSLVQSITAIPTQHQWHSSAMKSAVLCSSGYCFPTKAGFSWPLSMWSRGRGARAEFSGNRVLYAALCLVELVKARFVGLSKDMHLLLRVCCWECQLSSLTTHFKLKGDHEGGGSLCKGQIKYECMCMSWRAIGLSMILLELKC